MNNELVKNTMKTDVIKKERHCFIVRTLFLCSYYIVSNRSYTIYKLIHCTLLSGLSDIFVSYSYKTNFSIHPDSWCLFIQSLLNKQMVNFNFWYNFYVNLSFFGNFPKQKRIIEWKELITKGYSFIFKYLLSNFIKNISLKVYFHESRINIG